MIDEYGNNEEVAELNVLTSIFVMDIKHWSFAI